MKLICEEELKEMYENELICESDYQRIILSKWKQENGNGNKQQERVREKNVVKDVVNKGVDTGKESTNKAIDKVKNSLKNLFN